MVKRNPYLIEKYVKTIQDTVVYTDSDTIIIPGTKDTFLIPGDTVFVKGKLTIRRVSDSFYIKTSPDTIYKTDTLFIPMKNKIATVPKPVNVYTYLFWLFAVLLAVVLMRK